MPRCKILADLHEEMEASRLKEESGMLSRPGDLEEFKDLRTRSSSDE